MKSIVWLICWPTPTTAMLWGWLGSGRPCARCCGRFRQRPRPIGYCETVTQFWELVLHLAANIDFVLARLDGRELELSANADWPAVPEPTVAAWEDALAALDARYETLLERVGGLGDVQLAQPVVGRRYDVYAMLHGIIHHNVYHTGQIALLRDVSGSRAA